MDKKINWIKEGSDNGQLLGKCSIFGKEKKGFITIVKGFGLFSKGNEHSCDNNIVTPGQKCLYAKGRCRLFTEKMKNEIATLLFSETADETFSIESESLLPLN